MTTLASGGPSGSPRRLDLCRCADLGCAAGHAKDCTSPATRTLYRVDMEDRTGTRFCDPCADDAMEAGVYREKA